MGGSPGSALSFSGLLFFGLPDQSSHRTALHIP